MQLTIIEHGGSPPERNLEMYPAEYSIDENCNYLNEAQAVKATNLSVATLEKIAAECGAKLKIGRIKRYRKDILLEYINSLKA